jgi:hypothetical protein
MYTRRMTPVALTSGARLTFAALMTPWEMRSYSGQ